MKIYYNLKAILLKKETHNLYIHAILVLIYPNKKNKLFEN